MNSQKKDPIVAGDEIALPKDGFGRSVVLKSNTDVDTYVVLNDGGSSRFSLSWPAGSKTPADVYAILHMHINEEWRDPKTGEFPAKYASPAKVDCKAAQDCLDAKAAKKA